MFGLTVFRICLLSLTLALGVGVSCTAAAWSAYHNGNYYHGSVYHGAYGYHGGYDYHGYYGRWGVPGYGYVGVPVYGCRYVQTCYMNGGCFMQRVCN